MAIDIYKGTTLVMSVPEDDFLSLEGAQEELKKRAGRTVDAYATTAIEPEHALLWLTGLRRILPGLKQEPRVRLACEQLISLLAGATERRETLVVEGE